MPSGCRRVKDSVQLLISLLIHSGCHVKESENIMLCGLCLTMKFMLAERDGPDSQ